MIRVIKWTMSFTFSFLILSIPIGEKYFFEVIHNITSPYTDRIYGQAISSLQSGYDRGIALSKRAFTNSVPPEDFSERAHDKIQSISSGLKREEVEKIIRTQMENITVEEEEKLRRVLLESGY